MENTIFLRRCWCWYILLIIIHISNAFCPTTQSGTTIWDATKCPVRTSGSIFLKLSSFKSDPLARDALERTAAHLQKLKRNYKWQQQQQQEEGEGGGRSMGFDEDVDPTTMRGGDKPNGFSASSEDDNPYSDERERIYRQYLLQSANSLKDLLKERKLPRTGRKPDLARRLMQADLHLLYGVHYHGDENETVNASEKLLTEEGSLVESTSNQTVTSINSFAGIRLTPQARYALGGAGFTQPTPIQVSAIPRLFRGESLILHAETGSGKTLAYLLPITERLWADHGNSNGISLVLTPTRELAAQVAGVATVLAPPGSVRLIARPSNLLSDGSKEISELPNGGRKEMTGSSPRLFVASAKCIMHSLYGDGKMPAPPTSKPEAMSFLQNVRCIVLDEVDRLLAVKKSHSDKIYKKIHEKPAAVVCAAVARLTLGKAQVVAASATVGRPLRREVARVLGLTPQECPNVVHGIEETSVASDANLNSPNEEIDGSHNVRAVTIPKTVEHYIFLVDGLSTPGNILTNAYKIVQALKGSKRLLMVLTRDFGISSVNVVGALKHFGCQPEPESLLDALEADGTDQLIQVHRKVSGAIGVGQASSKPSGDGYLFVTGEDTVRGLHLDGLDIVVVLGRTAGPDEYTHIAGRTGRAGRRGAVINILGEADGYALQSWARMLHIDFQKLPLAEIETTFV